MNNKILLIFVIGIVVATSGCTKCFDVICDPELEEWEKNICERNGGEYISNPIYNSECYFYDGDVLTERCEIYYERERGPYIRCNS